VYWYERTIFMTCRYISPNNDFLVKDRCCRLVAVSLNIKVWCKR